MKWLNKFDLLINDKDDPEVWVVFRQVGWQGHSGTFYNMTQDPSTVEKGGFSPMYIQIRPE